MVQLLHFAIDIADNETWMNEEMDEWTNERRYDGVWLGCVERSAVRMVFNVDLA